MHITDSKQIHVHKKLESTELELMDYTSVVDNNTMKLLGLSGGPLIFKVTLIYGSTVVQLFWLSVKKVGCIY